MSYWQLLKLNPRTLGFGFLNAFFSGLGQTHFVALFSPIIMMQFTLSNTEYGSIYSLVTLVSGGVITFLGPLIDRYDVRLVSLFIGLGLICSQLLLLNEKSIYFIAVGLFGLRLFGQGLCSSISSISIARYFNAQRGKALSLTQVGYPTYEGLITPTFAILIGIFSFKQISLLLIAAVLIIYLPLAWTLTRSIPGFNKIDNNDEATPSSNTSLQKNWTRKEVFSHSLVYLMIPQVLMPPFALTGLLFHQVAIAELKHWDFKLMASGLAFFASGRVINSFMTGPLVDKYKAVHLFPYYQIPMSLGFVYLAYGVNSWTPAVCFLLFGLTVGSGGPIKSAIWAELYGIQHLGAIKSLFATLMVISTAISPALFGYIIDQNHSVGPLLIHLACINLLSMLLAGIGLKYKTDS